MDVQIIHHGGRNGVTGSCHQLVLDAANSLLVDCGLFQGAEASADGRSDPQALQIDFPLDPIRALVLTHVHIDHVGRIPWVLAAGYKGPILCSEASARLLPIVLQDAFELGWTRDARLVERYLKLIESRLVPLPWRQWHTVVDRPQLRCRIRLQPAGHILGSAYVECDVERGAQRRRILFSGDLGAPYAPLLAAPKPPWSADLVVLESTYGDRVHEARSTRRQRLQALIERALADGGTVLIPAFAIGRTQELLYELEDIIHRRPGDPWSRLPVFLDSPLAGRVSRSYQELQRFWDDEALARIRRGRKPLGFAQLVPIETHAEHLANVHRLSRSGEAAIVIAGSGMCTGGRIVNYLRAMLGDARHDVLFVGYQARGTPGHAIQTFGPRGGYVELDSERIAIRARIHTVAGYSAHADRDDLTRFVTRMRHLPQEVRLVHGDRDARLALAAHLVKATGDRMRVLA